MDVEDKDSVIDLEGSKRIKSRERYQRSVTGSISSSKKYKKEEHYLKKVLMSRLSGQSSRPSTPSLMSLSAKRQKKRRRKNLINPISFMPSAIVSCKSAISNSSSFTNFSNIHFQQKSSMKQKSQIFKKRISGQIVMSSKSPKIKLEENEMPRIRKRVCRKVNEILVKEFKLQKSMSKRLTLSIEGKVNHHYPSSSESYINVIKSIFRKLRVSSKILKIARKMKLN